MPRQRPRLSLIVEPEETRHAMLSDKEIGERPVERVDRSEIAVIPVGSDHVPPPDAPLAERSIRLLGQHPEHDLRGPEVRSPPRDPVDARLLEVVAQDGPEPEVVPRRQGGEPGVSGTIARDEPGVRQLIAVDDDPGLADPPVDDRFAVVAQLELA